MDTYIFIRLAFHRVPAFQRVEPLLARFPRQRPAITTETPEKLESEPLT
jgi:hypothetical protein